MRALFLALLLVCFVAAISAQYYGGYGGTFVFQPTFRNI